MKITKELLAVLKAEREAYFEAVAEAQLELANKFLKEKEKEDAT